MFILRELFAVAAQGCILQFSEKRASNCWMYVETGHCHVLVVVFQTKMWQASAPIGTYIYVLS